MPSKRLGICFLLLFSVGPAPSCESAAPDPDQLRTTEWAENGMTQDPVALAFDHQGRLFVVETARRTTVDIDMRSHKSWLLDDLASDDFDSMRDFFRSKMAPERSDVNKSWLQDRNKDGKHDFRDLTTVSERIRVLRDTNGDGKADQSTVYAENFSEEFTGVAAGVMPYEGDVLMTVYPDLWRLRDLDGDNQADGRVSMFRGFGVHAAFDGHDLHGLTVGPEGKIYFSCGDNGFSIPTKEGTQLHYPNTGGVLRMNPDGSDLEVYAIGLRNVQEFDFDPYGNMFAVDNDGDLEDERERAVYIAEGSDSGWRLNWQFRSPGWAKYNGGMTYNPWTAEGMWKPQHPDQPAYITPPMQNYSVGPGGFKFNPGTALSPAYRDFFFCVQFPVKQITAFRTQAKGAGFEMVDEHVFHSGLMVSSLNFGPDGGLYMADWIGKWQPNGEGIIYRIDDPKSQGTQTRKDIKQQLARGASSQTKSSLATLLGHPDRRIRRLAQTELVRRRRGKLFLRVARDDSAQQLARVHALWGLIQLKSSRLQGTLANQLPWDDSDRQIRQQCARLAGDLRLPDAEPMLIGQLSDDAPLVRSHAAIALGKVGTAKSADVLIGMIAENDDQDPFLRHAAVQGLAGSTSADVLARQTRHSSAAVRLSAVLALRKQKSPLIVKYIQDDNIRVQREAIRGIHDDFSIPAALPEVAKLLSNRDIPADEPILRRILSANLRVGDAAAAERLANYITDPTSKHGRLTTQLKVEAIQCLAAWDQSPLVDRVEGRIRKSTRLQPNAGRAALVKHLDRILLSPAVEVTFAATTVCEQLDIPVDTQRMKQWVTDERQPAEQRAAALHVLSQQSNPMLDSLVSEILKSPWEGDLTLSKAAFEILAARSPSKAFAEIDLQHSSLAAKRFFINQLGRLDVPAAHEQLSQLLKQYDALPNVTLELLTAARSHHDANNNTGLGAQLKSINREISNHPFGEYQFSIAEGDARQGEEIFRHHVTAQCVRCHAAGGDGKQAGPDLSTVASKKDRQYLLEALVAPSATIAKGFNSTTLALEDGRFLTGTIIRDDSEQITMGTQDAKTIVIDKSQIEERLPQTTSAMPSMRDVLSPLEIRDVVSYLTTLKQPKTLAGQD